MKNDEAFARLPLSDTNGPVSLIAGRLGCTEGQVYSSALGLFLVVGILTTALPAVRTGLPASAASPSESLSAPVRTDPATTPARLPRSALPAHSAPVPALGVASSALLGRAEAETVRESPSAGGGPTGAPSGEPPPPPDEDPPPKCDPEEPVEAPVDIADVLDHLPEEADVLLPRCEESGPNASGTSDVDGSPVLRARNLGSLSGSSSVEARTAHRPA